MNIRLLTNDQLFQVMEHHDVQLKTRTWEGIERAKFVVDKRFTMSCSYRMFSQRYPVDVLSFAFERNLMGGDIVLWTAYAAELLDVLCSTVCICGTDDHPAKVVRISWASSGAVDLTELLLRVAAVSLAFTKHPEVKAYRDLFL